MHNELKVSRRHNGIAGQYVYTVYRTLDGVRQSPVQFVGSEYGAPVVLVYGNGAQTFVDDWKQYGDELNPEWIRRFYGVYSIGNQATLPSEE